MSLESFFVDRPQITGFKGCITPLIVVNAIIWIMACLLYLAIFRNTECELFNYFGIFSIVNIMVSIVIIVAYAQPSDDRIVMKRKLYSLKNNKNLLKEIVQDAVNEETKDNNSIDKEKVKKITTTLIAESLILDDEKK